MTSADKLTFLLLATTSVAYSGSVMGMERLRLALTNGRLPNVVGVWTFAGVLTLPWHLLSGLVVIVYAAEWPSRKVVGQAKPWRYVYSTAAGIAACLSAALVSHAAGGPMGALLALIVFYSVNLGLVAAAMVTAGHSLQLFTDPKAHATEISTQCLGAALATLASWHVASATLVLPALIAVHCWSTRDTVKTEEAFDAATGLWSELAWSTQASELIRPGRFVTVILVDPDEAGRQGVASAAARSCLYPNSVLGSYASRQVVIAAPAGIASCGRLLAGRIKKQVEASGIRCMVASATSDRLEIRHLLVDALSDLMAERHRAGVLDRW